MRDESRQRAKGATRKTPLVIDLTWGISRGETLIHAWNVRVHRSWIVRDDGYVHTIMDTAQRDVRKLHVQSIRICARRTSAACVPYTLDVRIYFESRVNFSAKPVNTKYHINWEKPTVWWSHPAIDLTIWLDWNREFSRISQNQDRRSWSVRDSRNDTRHNCWKQLVTIQQLEN